MTDRIIITILALALPALIALAVMTPFGNADWENCDNIRRIQ